MISLLDETVHSAASAAKFVRRRYGRRLRSRCSPVTIWRWATKGLIACSGQRVYLEYVRLGRRFVTSEQAIARFAQSLVDNQGQAARPRPGGQNTEEAVADLQRSGFFK